MLSRVERRHQRLDFWPVAAGNVGNLLEWYDFVVFAFLAPVIGARFFPSADALSGLINAFGVFAVGYLMRPIGGILFGHLGDRLGRKRALQLSMVVMAIPTTLMAALPSHAEAGVLAPVLLVALRLAQGLSVGESTRAPCAISSRPRHRDAAPCSAASGASAPPLHRPGRERDLGSKAPPGGGNRAGGWWPSTSTRGGIGNGQGKVTPITTARQAAEQPIPLSSITITLPVSRDFSGDPKGKTVTIGGTHLAMMPAWLERTGKPPVR
jgi:hypothetical protein